MHPCEHARRCQIPPSGDLGFGMIYCFCVRISLFFNEQKCNVHNVVEVPNTIILLLLLLLLLLGSQV